MAIEGKYSNYPGLVLREPFNSEQECQGDLYGTYSFGEFIVRDIIVQEIRPDLDATDVTVNKNGALFNGSTSGIDLGSTLNGLTGAYSICGFIKPYSFGENNAGHILSNEDRFNLFITTSNNRLGFSRNGGTVVYSADNSIVLGRWTFFYVASESDGTTNIYLSSLDSAPVLSGSADQAAGTPVSSSNNVHIGNRTSDDRSFDGLINIVKLTEGIIGLDRATQIFTEKLKHIK